MIEINAKKASIIVLGLLIPMLLYLLGFRLGRQFVLIFSAIMVLWFVGYMFICCFKMVNKDKWLWLFVITIGVGVLEFNLKTGLIQFPPYILHPPFAMQILSGAWKIRIAFPLGAVLFYIYKISSPFLRQGEEG